MVTVVAILVLLGFVAVVLTLAVRFAPQTRAGACCAPADPARDRRMRGA
jgi:hypothetical protein